MSDSSSSSDASVSSLVEDDQVEEEEHAEAASENEGNEEVEEAEEVEEQNEASKHSEEASPVQEEDSDDSDVVVSRKPKRPSKVELDATDLFGELSDDDDDDDAKKSGDSDEQEGEDAERVAEGEEGEAAEEGAEADEVEEEPVIERLIKVEMPSMRFDLGSELFYVRLPNFLSIDPKPFDPETYEAEGAGEEILDEEGRTRLKMSVENTIRWQYIRETDEDGMEQIKRISNARMVRWSDGSMSLHLGAEIFDIHIMSEQQDYNHMYVKQGNGLVGQAVFRRKLNFRPHSTDSLTHRKMTLSMADKTKRVQQVKEMALGKLKNPEMGKAQLIKREEDALKATVRRETQQRRVRDRFSARSLEEGMGDDDEGAISLTSIKRRVMTKPRTSYGSNADIVDDDYTSSSSEEADAAEDSDNEEEVGASSLTASAKAKKRRLVVNDD